MSTAQILDNRLLELSKMKSGWMEGSGEKTSQRALQLAQEVLDRLFSMRNSVLFPRPGIFSTEDGGISLEWACPERFLSLEISPDEKFCFFYLTSDSAQSVDVEIKDKDRAIRMVLETLGTSRFFYVTKGK